MPERTWIEDNQLGRRNLTPDQFRYYLGRKYERAKKQGFKGNQWTDASGQNDQRLTSAERIAKEHGTTEKTVRRAADYSRDLDAIAEVAGPQVNGKSRDIAASKIGRSRRVL